MLDLYELADARCRDATRRAEILGHPSLNGVDFVEYEHRPAGPAEHVLVVAFVKPLPDAPYSDPDGAYGLTTQADLARVLGGARVVGVRVLGIQVVGDRLEIAVDRAGDFSTYWLLLGWRQQAGGAWQHVIPNLDRQLSAAPVNFKADCPSELDCRHEPECPAQVPVEPVLDYLAKDYASFRRLLLDLIPQRNPRWLERNPADLGMALVELLAYAGDRLSYFQDAVATEAYLDTARHRVSARRHARLIDYRVHDGRNAWGYVQLDVGNAAPRVVPAGTPVLTRVSQPLRKLPTEVALPAPPGPVIPNEKARFDEDPALRGVVIFETRQPLTARAANNRLALHTWGNRECCLPRGATGAYLYALEPPVGNTRQAVRPVLQPGDYLLLEEVKGPATGRPADADPAHRQVVRLSAVEDAEDALYRDVLLYDPASGAATLQPVTAAGQSPLPLARVTWGRGDALTFPLCLTAVHPEQGSLGEISIARGNVVPCDHGRTVVEELPPPAPSGDRAGLLQVRLPRAPLTFMAPAPPAEDDPRGFRPIRASGFDADPRDARPAVELDLRFPPAEEETWVAVPDLLDSHPHDRHFVVEVENDLVATLRFGDDEYGRRPVGSSGLVARYRVGNGPAGNLGSGSLVHVVSPPSLANWPTIERVWQPLPTHGGADPETIEEVRQRAPAAFHAKQFRAVTEADYEQAALELPAVAAAKCSFRWTGSWLTVFVAIHPSSPLDLVTLPGGRTRLSDGLAAAARAHLTRYKLAGYDLELRTAQYVPLEIEIRICVGLGYFRGDVLEAVSRALSVRQFADGSAGFFHPSRFSFGQSVYLSQLYEAVERVDGVDSAVVAVFKRYWELAGDELANGVIPMGSDEIARLDNDPNFRENGVLRLVPISGL